MTSTNLPFFSGPSQVALKLCFIKMRSDCNAMPLSSPLLSSPLSLSRRRRVGQTTLACADGLAKLAEEEEEERDRPNWKNEFSASKGASVRPSVRPSVVYLA